MRLILEVWRYVVGHVNLVSTWTCNRDMDYRLNHDNSELLVTIGLPYLALCQATKNYENYPWFIHTVYPKKYAHGFVVLCFVVVMQSFIMNSHEVSIHIHQGCFAGTGAIVRLPQGQWSKPDGYGKISQCITTTKHSKAKTVCIFLGIHCILRWLS